jgi:hypothetical protein
MNGMYLCRRNQTPQSCTLDCVAQGFRYVLRVDGNKVFLLEGDSGQLARYAGGKASISGVAAADGTHIEVTSISSAK